MDLFGMALGMRWLWLSRTDPSHCWRVMPLREDPMVIGFFYNSITLHLGDGRLFAFWTDPWLNGAALSSAYPELVVAVPARLCRVHMVASVLDNNAWVRDVQGALTIPILIQFLELHHRPSTVVLRHGIQDLISW
jgi:hypothetical protein